MILLSIIVAQKILARIAKSIQNHQHPLDYHSRRRSFHFAIVVVFVSWLLISVDILKRHHENKQIQAVKQELLSIRSSREKRRDRLLEELHLALERVDQLWQTNEGLPDPSHESPEYSPLQRDEQK